MTFRHILVQTDETEGSARRCRLAARLADRFQAHLTGVFPRPSAERHFLRNGPVVDVPVTVPRSAIEAFDADMAVAAKAAREGFEAAAPPAGRADWRSIDGDNVSQMIACMRRADLTVAPAGAPPMLSGAGLDAPSLAIGSGAPMIITPQAVDADAVVGRRVLVGWNGSREAFRALQAAWPLIVQAEQVRVLMVSRDEDEPKGMLRRYFDSHGVKAELAQEPSAPGSAGEALLGHAAELRADLIVMGLYGHARVQELLLGGASRDVLAKANIPIFVAH